LRPWENKKRKRKWGKQNKIEFQQDGDSMTSLPNILVLSLALALSTHNKQTKSCMSCLLTSSLSLGVSMSESLDQGVKG
jgi:hypothetical protein